VAKSLQQVLQGTNPPASRHFARFAKDNYLEEGLLFWLDSNDFLLLFQKQDMHVKAKAMFELYMGPTAKYKVNTSDHVIAEIKAVVDAEVNDAVFDNQLFIKAQKETETFLELDVWDRYVEWSKGAGKIGKVLERSSTSQELYDESKLLDRDKAREAVVELLKLPHEIESFKELARGLDCVEAIDFYLDVKKYQMLFEAADMKDTARRIWKMYLDDKAERMVNLPATQVKALKKVIIDNDCEKVDVKTFDKANKEMLNLITDNVYPAWLKKNKANAAGAATSTEASPAPAPAKSGGCCVIS